MNKISVILAGILVLAVPVVADQVDLQRRVADAVAGANVHTGYSFYVIDEGEEFAVASGQAAPDGAAITSAHMYRIASVTKTFTAAAALRLVETGQLALSAPLSTLINPEYNTMLQQDGYDTDAITLHQVLGHTAGLFDHPQSENFLNSIMENPHKEWTARTQIKASVDWGDPVGAPGEKFSYSDTGYVLLGNIIERASGMTLPIAVRTLLGFDKHGLDAVVWERGDMNMAPDDLRVHQYFQGQDTYGWSPSIDLYGGGGLVASPKGMARFYALLLGGKIFDKPETLEKMLSATGHPENSPYRLGVFEKDYDGVKVYEHGGFWGTLVMQDKDTGITIAGAALKQRDYVKMRDIMTGYLKSRK